MKRKLRERSPHTMVRLTSLITANGREPQLEQWATICISCTKHTAHTNTNLSNSIRKFPWRLLSHDCVVETERIIQNAFLSFSFRFVWRLSDGVELVLRCLTALPCVLIVVEYRVTLFIRSREQLASFLLFPRDNYCMPLSSEIQFKCIFYSFSSLHITPPVDRYVRFFYGKSIYGVQQSNRFFFAQNSFVRILLWIC